MITPLPPGTNEHKKMNENGFELVKYIVAALTGLGAKYGIDFFQSKKKESRVDFDTIVKRLDIELTRSQQEREQLSEENRQLQKKIIKMQGELMSLKYKITLLESAQNHSPLPMWLKDTDGTMLAVNDSYDAIFLKPNGIQKGDYVGHFDADVWPETLAQEYKENDEQVLNTRKVFRGYENVLIDGKKHKWRIIKYPRYAGEIIVGIAGIAIPESWEEGFEHI